MTSSLQPRNRSPRATSVTGPARDLCPIFRLPDVEVTVDSIDSGTISPKQAVIVNGGASREMGKSETSTTGSGKARSPQSDGKVADPAAPKVPDSDEALLLGVRGDRRMVPVPLVGTLTVPRVLLSWTIRGERECARILRRETQAIPRLLRRRLLLSARN